MKVDLDITLLPDWLDLSGEPLLVAGPCSAETEEQVMQTARQLSEFTPVRIFRAGIWKPRTRPDSFEGMGEPALEWVVKAGKENALLTAVEVANANHVEQALKAGIDILWIGARTTVNPFYVQEIADAVRGTSTPVFVKNPVNPDLPLWLGAFERLNKAGIKKLVAVHRGFSSYSEKVFRNAPDWKIPIELMRIQPNLPVICDPSHIAGERDLLHQVAQKALDLDMQGIMLETHPDPDHAWSDAKQQITPFRLKELYNSLIFRKRGSENLAFNTKLEDLRHEIDKLDRVLIDTIGQRMKIIAEIGQYKKENKITILQMDRWNKILQNARNYSDVVGLEREFVVAVFNQLHLESIKIQTEVMNEADRMLEK